MSYPSLNIVSTSKLNVCNLVHMPRLSRAELKSNSKYKRRKLSFFLLSSLLFVFLLVSSPLISLFSGVSPFVSGAESIQVGTEGALREAVDNAKAGEPITIALTADITLGSALAILDGKTITLTSAGGTGFFKLVGLADTSVIDVYRGAMLTLDGVIVTHETGYSGQGIIVSSGGTLIMLDGKISGNTNINGDGFGGGVEIDSGGVFELVGGLISDNVAGVGGGVYSEGTFKMSGGKISNNQAMKLNDDETDLPDSMGGGVFAAHSGSFVLSDGEISNNAAVYGGGVAVLSSSLSMSGGSIANNKAAYNSTAGAGGGVYLCDGSLSVSGGMIANNLAASAGGGVYLARSFFLLAAGQISNNTANDSGGGVFQYSNIFRMIGGVISSNTAVRGAGGGVCNHEGKFTITSGEISGNTAVLGGGMYLGGDTGSIELLDGMVLGNVASNNGGGVWVTSTNDVVDFERLYVGETVIFSGNRARAAYSRNSMYDAVYSDQIKSIRWSAFLTQGYNNYDISYTSGVSLGTYGVSVSGSYASSSGAGDYLTGAYVTVSAGIRAGYVFSGWAINEGGITLANGVVASFTMPARNVTITATWTPISTGDSNNNGGSGGSSPNNPPGGSSPSTPWPNPSVSSGVDGESKDGVVGSIWGTALTVVVVLLVGGVVAVVVVVVLLRRRSRV